ncbi:hypothetical protein F1880_000224 [Penicillium rolfsii]|nr:hypothetical protein F1880_000224 [Penicillium rolfsii]
MTGLSKILPTVHKFRAALARRKKSKDRLHQLNHADLSPPPPSPWGLPVEIQIQIFGYCGSPDFYTLKLVCKAFNALLTSNEHEIVRQYLRQRRHGTLPSPIDNERTYTRNPEDDVVLLSDLFPPSKSARGGHLYTFRYLHGLRTRQKQCSMLCYYLADRVMERFIQTEPIFLRSSFPTRKAERTALVKRGKASIWFHLAPLMYYTLYFLQSYASARREHTNMLLREYEAGRLSVPIPIETRRRMYQDLQTRILQAPPFSNTAALIATHHCMYLLVSYIRYTMAPEAGIDDSWISSLLMVSPFTRIVEFFSAEIGDGGNQRMQRKDFMYNFYRDMTVQKKDHMNSVIFGQAAERNSHSSVRELWFDAASRELESRQAMPHDVETVWTWNEMEQASRGQLFNTSWTLHRLSPLHHAKDFETLLNNEAALKAYATRLRDQLTGDVLAGLHSAATIAEDDSLSKTGALQDCRWEFFVTEPSGDHPSSTASIPGILVTLEYENITYKAALLSDADSNRQPRAGVTALPLLLTKFPNALRQTFITFLTSNFDTYVSNLRLSSSFLSARLEEFVAELEGAVVEDVIRELQLTLAFSPSVAPALRNVNVGIPRASLVGFLRKEAGTSKEKGKGKSKARVPLIANLTAYLETHLAMKVDLDGSGQDKVARQHVRLSKVACAAFVLGSEGRMKLVVDVRGAEGDEERESPSLRASETLLRAVIRRAMMGDQVTT